MKPIETLTNRAESCVCYVLLYLGIPVSLRFDNVEKHFSIVRAECKPLGVKIRRLLVHSESHKDSNGRYLFNFADHARKDDKAVRLAESFLYAVALVRGPMIDPAHDSLILRVPSSMVARRKAVTMAELIELEMSRVPHARMLAFPAMTISTVTHTAACIFEAAWRAVRITMQNEHLFEATRFLKRSVDNFYVAPGQIREVAGDPNMIAQTSSHQTNFEDALQNAFKAIEAVIGDPPKDDLKLRLKLKAIGIDPDEKVGYVNKATIQQTIRDMNCARDKKAAHGSTKNRIIGAADLLHFQECSVYVVTSAIETARGSALLPYDPSPG